MREESRCRLAAWVLLYAPSHIHDNTYHGLCYTSRGALAGRRNRSMRVLLNIHSFIRFPPECRQDYKNCTKTPNLSVVSFWHKQDRGMCYPVCGMVHIKEPLLLIEKSSPCCDDIGILLSLSGPLPYVQRHIIVNKNVLRASLNKPFPSLLL